MSHCPVCTSQGNGFKSVSAFGGNWHIHKCSRCRLEYTDPMPSAQVLQAFYASYEDVRAGLEVSRRNALRNAERLARLGLTTDSRLLDYGSGKNVFVTTGDSVNWIGYDPHTDNANPDVLKPGYYDGIVSWGVLEHVVDPLAMMKTLHPLLKGKGYLVMTTVDIDGAIPYRFKPPEHLTYWTQEAAACLSQATGFELVSYEPYYMVQHRQVYMDIILRTLPASLKKTVHYEDMPEFVEIPTNEVMIICRKQ